jgi:hypothetical protein
MARKPAVPKESVQEPVQETATVAPEEKKKVRRFVGKKFSYYHPFQAKSIPMGGDGVVLEIDSWLQSQIESGYIVEV